MTVCSPTKASSVAVNSAFPIFVRGQAGSFEGELIFYFDARVSTISLIMRGARSMEHGCNDLCHADELMLLSYSKERSFLFFAKK